MHYEIEGKFDGLIAIPLARSMILISLRPHSQSAEKRKHDWIEILGEVEHSD